MPPALILQFSGRVILARTLRDPDQNFWDEKRQTMRRPSTATAYCWIVWLQQGGGQAGRTEFAWIDPEARQRLTRPGDYPAPTLEPMTLLGEGT